jgi:hypothetical protein
VENNCFIDEYHCELLSFFLRRKDQGEVRQLKCQGEFREEPHKEGEEEEQPGRPPCVLPRKCVILGH